MPGLKNIVMRLFRVTERLKGNEAGIFLIEALVALAILGLIAVAFVGAMGTAAKGISIADEQATAESLVRSEIEYVKSQGYINYADPDPGEYELIATPVSYSVQITAVPIDPDTGQPLPSGEDEGIQKITVTVKRNEKSILIIENYKVD